MPSIRVACPSCKAPLKASPEVAGKKARCRKCGTSFRIPSSLGGVSSDSGNSATPAAEEEEFVATLAEEETASPGGLPLDDDPPPGGKPGTAEVFSFTAQPASEPATPAAKSRPRSKGLPAAPPPAKETRTPRPYRSRQSSSLAKLLVLALVLLVGVGAGVGGVLVYLGQVREEPGETARQEGPSSETPAAPAEPGEAPEETSGGNGTPAGAAPKAPRSASRPALALPPGKPVSFQPIRAKLEMVQPPEKVLSVEAAFTTVRRAFPPLRPDVDPAVLWQSAPGFQGIGEKLTLDLFSPQTGGRVGRLAIDGDGSPAPLCDLSVTADLLAHAHAKAGTVWVWNTRDGNKVLNAFEPYAEKAEHRQAGLAAIYLTVPPDRLITVSTAGAVHAWDIASKKLLGEYVVPSWTAGSVAAGKTVCPGPGRQSVVLLVGGSLHKVDVRPKVAGSIVADLGGEAAQSFGLAASGAGRVVYAFETATKGKKEKVVMALAPDGNHVFHRWPEDAGDPVAAGWCGDQLATVATSRGGAVWFEAEGKSFRPLALVQTPGDRAIHIAADSHWSLLPDPADAKLSNFVEYTEPQRGLIDPLTAGSKRPALTLRLDDKGLFK